MSGSFTVIDDYGISYKARNFSIDDLVELSFRIEKHSKQHKALTDLSEKYTIESESIYLFLNQFRAAKKFGITTQRIRRISEDGYYISGFHYFLKISGIDLDSFDGLVVDPYHKDIVGWLYANNDIFSNHIAELLKIAQLEYGNKHA